MPAATYEHYFLSAGADTSKVVSHKPVNLLVHTLCQGQKHTFSIAIKTSEDKIKRRLNKTVACKEVYLCCDTDVAYQERRQAQEAAAAAAALLGGGGDDDDAPPPSLLPLPTTKAQLAARQDQLNYIGSKELFTSYPGGGIVCLRLRPAEEPTTTAKKRTTAAAAAQAAANGDATAHAPTPLPPDVSEASSDGFLFSVETKGGKSAGRQKQRYVLLKRSCIYTLLLPCDIRVTRIETRDKSGDTTAIKHWISTHAQMAIDTNHAVTKWAEQTPPAETFAASMFAQPAAMINAMTQSQQGAAAAAALFMGTMSNLISNGLSPFSSQGVSPAGEGRPRNESIGSGAANAFLASSTPHSHSSGAGSNQISPSNNPYLFSAAATAAFNHRSPPGQSHMLPYGGLGMMHGGGMLASSSSSAAAAFAHTLAAMTSSSGAAVNFPSPTSQLMANLGLMLPHSNNVSPSGMGAMGMGLGMGAMGMPFTQQQQTQFNPMLSNPGSNRSNAALSNFSAHSSAVMSPAMSPANQQQQQQALQRSQQQSAQSMPNGVLLGTQQLQQPPSDYSLKPASQFSEHSALQLQIEQLQAMLHQQRVQQQLQQQQAINAMMMQQQQQQMQNALAQQQRPTAGGTRQGSGKFDFSIPTAAVSTQPIQQQSFYAQQQQQQHVPIGSIPPLSSTSTATTRSAGASTQAADASQRHMYQSAIKEEDDHNGFSNDSPQFVSRGVSRGHTGGTAGQPSSGFESMMDSHQHPTSHSQLQHATLNSAYWNPPNPHAPVAHPTSSSLDLPSVRSPDFLCGDLFTEPAHLHAGLEVPSSFFASPLVDSADSSNSSHSSQSQGHSPMAGLRPTQHTQLHTSPLPGSAAAAALPSASNLATALRAPAFPLLGGSQEQLLIAAPLSSNSSTSGGSAGDHRRNKRKKHASTKKRRAGSASSSVVSESAHAMRRGTGYSLSPRQWKVAEKKAPFRCTLSVLRSNHAGRFKPDDLIQVRFGGVFLDASKIDCYKRHALIDIPLPPSTASLLSSAGVPVASPPLCRTSIEVDLELHVNGHLKFATAFSYKLGPAAVAAGDATTSSSSDPDDSSDGDDDDGSDRNNSGSDIEDDRFGGGGGGGGAGHPDSASDGSGSPDRPDRSSGDSKRRRNGGGEGGGTSSNPGGSSNYTTQHSTGAPAVRLVADFDSIPLFSRGVLKSFPLLSQGLQDLLQSYLLGTSGARPDLCEEESADASVIMEEVDDGAGAAAAAASALDSSTLRKRFSTGSRGFEKLQQSAALSKVAAEARAAGAAGFSPPRSSQTVPNTPVKSAFRRPNGANGNAIAAAKQLSASARATARVLFLQAISSQQPLQFVNAAVSATLQAALQPTAPPAWCAHQGINGTDSYGFTLLHYSVAAGLVPLAEKLLMLGANPHLQARTAHASHAFSPAQLLQLRQVSTEERAARRVARAAKRATKALTQGSPVSGSPTLTSTSAVSSPHPKPPKPSSSRSHDKKKRRTSVEDAEESDSVGSVPSGSVASEEHELSSETSESVMADAAGDTPASPLQTAHQPLFAGFSSLHSLAPSPYGSAASSASNSLTSTPTNAAALKAARTPVTGRDILSASQKSFHFGVSNSQPTNSANLSSTQLSADKLLQASNFHMQTHQHQHQPLHIYHVHQPLHQMHPGPQDKSSVQANQSTATTAAPTPSSHTHSVLSSPLGMWRPSPASAAMSPQMTHTSWQSPVPPTLTPMDAVETNKALASIFHAHSVSPQGLSFAAAASQAHFTHSAAAAVHSPSNAGRSSMPHHFALTANPALESFVKHRFQMAQQRLQAKKYLAHLQAQLRQSQAIPQPSPPSPSFAQSEEDREQQRELVMLELALLILYAQKAMTALNLSLPPSSAPALDADALTSPMQSLHIHTLRSLLGQFQILRRYFMAYRKYQEAQAEVAKLAEGICIEELAATSAAAAGGSPASSPRKSPRKSTGSRFESLAAASVSSSAAAAASSSSSLQSPASFAAFSDDSIFALFVHVAAVECALRDQVVHMQRVLAPFMQRALLQTKISNEKTRAQNQMRARAAAAASAQANSDVHVVQSGLTSLSVTSPLRQRGMPSTPLSQGHLSRTHSGQLSLNIVGSLHPDREDDELAIHIREVHAVDVLQGRRIDLVVNPSLEAQESAAEAARDSARKQAAHSRLQSPEKSLLFSASLEEGTAHLAPPPLLAPHPSPSNAAATPKPAASDAQLEFQYRPSAASAAAAAPAASTPGHKYALLIGVNHYSPELAVSPLLGCENDVMRIGGILQSQYGFDIPMAHASSDDAIVFGSQSRSHMLLHQCATRQAVRRALQSLAAAAQSPADSVIVYFAGHGFHACVLLYDGVLDYSEFAQLLSGIATKDCTFVSDCCSTERVPRALMNTVSARKTASAGEANHNTSLTLEQMRALVGSSSPDVAADRMHAAQAAAEILATMTPDSIRPRQLGVADAADAADADGEDEEESDGGESDMADVPAPAAASSSSSRRGGGGAGVQYRGLAFNKIEPREPTSQSLTVPTRSSTRRSVSDEVDDDPPSAGPCSLRADGDHALKAASQRVIPVIQRLLSRRGYLARGLLSQADERASEMQSSTGSWHGAYTARLCAKLESAASPSTRCEPANPCIVSLRAILFHDEDGGNLSAGGSTSSASSSRSNSLSGSVESLLPLLAASHLADEIDPSSAGAEMDLGSMLADATADDEAFVGEPVASEHDHSDDSSSSNSSDDEDDTRGAAACAAAVAAFDASCEQDEQASEAEPVLLLSEDESAAPTEDDEPAAVVEVTDDPSLPIVLAVLPARSNSSLLFVFLLALYSWILAPIRAVQRAWAPADVGAVAAPVSAAPSSSLVLLPPPSPKSRQTLDSSPCTPRPASADLLTTEAASDSSSSGSSGRARFTAQGSDSDSSVPSFDLRGHSPEMRKRALHATNHRDAFSSH